MRCAALLSGGKDSVAAVEVAQASGFGVVGAIVLRPAQDDAWMFHTPNLGVAAGVARCLGLDVLEHPARPDPEDEVRDLEAALRAAKARWSLDAVVSGAVASEYQRVRIEAAGHAAGLRTFTPLWHKDPNAYLRPMLAAYDVRLARCAADGVPNAWAGERLDAARLDAMLRHPSRPHPAGEGGEYETLVLDAPHFVERLVVERAHVEATASRATWVVDAWRTEAKPSVRPSGGLEPAAAPPAPAGTMPKHAPL